MYLKPARAMQRRLSEHFWVELSNDRDFSNLDSLNFSLSYTYIILCVTRRTYPVLRTFNAFILKEEEFYVCEICEDT